MPLNLFVTIDWELAGVENARAATMAWLKRLRDFLGHKGRRTAFVWVIERGEEFEHLHAHVLVHVPPDLAGLVRKYQSRWLKQCGAKRRKGVFDSRWVGRERHWCGECGCQHYLENLKSLLNYLLKDADQNARLSFGITRIGSFGEVTGKRCGASQNIGSAARRKGSATPTRDTQNG